MPFCSVWHFSFAYSSFVVLQSVIYIYIYRNCQIIMQKLVRCQTFSGEFLKPVSLLSTHFFLGKKLPFFGSIHQKYNEALVILAYRTLISLSSLNKQRPSVGVMQSAQPADNYENGDVATFCFEGFVIYILLEDLCITEVLLTNFKAQLVARVAAGLFACLLSNLHAAFFISSSPWALTFNKVITVEVFFDILHLRLRDMEDTYIGRI